MSKNLNHTRYLQEAYLKISNSYNEKISLELLEIELKKLDSKLELVSVLENVFDNYSNKFKIELLMMPNWATKSKPYKINLDIYTHIKIKDSLFEKE